MDSVDDVRNWGLAAAAALDEPTRRRVYDHVCRQARPMSRDEAAAALQLPRSTAAFHLEQLARVGLLDVVYQRLSGRAGPGAGRPSKLYHRSQRQVAVSVPERRYELAGRLLAAAVAEAEATGEPPRAALTRHARELGRQLGEAASAGHDPAAGRDAALRTLEEHGFEPRADDAGVVLRNCPFHALARQHPELVCGMNLCLLDGLLDALPATGLSARLEPAPGACCVRLRPDVVTEAPQCT
ncbi:MAG: helix-turn-helix domain-containing protein [Micromonosporaceae bacterium]|nr:helix-turn-helix domain-containing protein [Micromonosporaceae bacterium]